MLKTELKETRHMPIISEALKKEILGITCIQYLNRNVKRSAKISQTKVKNDIKT